MHGVTTGASSARAVYGLSTVAVMMPGSLNVNLPVSLCACGRCLTQHLLLVPGPSCLTLPSLVGTVRLWHLMTGKAACHYSHSS